MSIQAQWHLLKTTGTEPLPRSSHDLSIINHQLYLWGGENQPRVPINSDMYRLTIIEDNSELCGVWEIIEDVSGDIPVPRIAHAQCVVDGEMYFFGGRLGIGMEESPLNDLYRFSPVTCVWEALEVDGEMPIERSFHKMVSIGRSLFVFGGCAAVGRLNDLWRFDIDELKWTQLSSFDACSGRGGTSISPGRNGETIIVATGFSGQENNDVYVYDIAEDTWSVVVESGTDAFRARSVCASTSINVSTLQLFVISGGEVNASEKGHQGAGDFTDDLVIIDATTGEVLPYEFTSTTRPHPSRGWNAMASDNNRIILFGGLSGNDESPIRLNDTYILTLHV